MKNRSEDNNSGGAARAEVDYTAALKTVICESGKHTFVKGPFSIGVLVDNTAAASELMPLGFLPILHCARCGMIILDIEARSYVGSDIVSSIDLLNSVS